MQITWKVCKSALWKVYLSSEWLQRSKRCGCDWSYCSRGRSFINFDEARDTDVPRGSHHSQPWVRCERTTPRPLQSHEDSNGWRSCFSCAHCGPYRLSSSDHTDKHDSLNSEVRRSHTVSLNIHIRTESRSSFEAWYHIRCVYFIKPLAWRQQTCCSVSSLLWPFADFSWLQPSSPCTLCTYIVGVSACHYSCCRSSQYPALNRVMWRHGGKPADFSSIS